MKEKHLAYKITHESNDVIMTHFEFEEDKMLDLLKDIQKAGAPGIYWIVKQRDSQPQEPLCIIDSAHKRIYYHYSGDVEDLGDMIKKLSK
jgi:hypothetical protein